MTSPKSLGVQHVAMEATGVYWKPVWHVLEGHFVLVLANAAHVKNVPGRKTDVNDAMWLADLLAHGLIRASFVPPVAVQELRTLTRTRKQFVRERGSHAQRIEKILEDANLKLSSAISDILGKSGRAVLKAISRPTHRRHHAELVERQVDAVIGQPALAESCRCGCVVAEIERYVAYPGAPADQWRQDHPCAWAAIKVLGFHRLRARRGAKKAIIAFAGPWHMLREAPSGASAPHTSTAPSNPRPPSPARGLQQIGLRPRRLEGGRAASGLRRARGLLASRPRRATMMR